MKIISSEPVVFEEVKKISYGHFADSRGYFTETCRISQMVSDLGIDGFEVQQINESASQAGVLRGMHFQWNPPQGKLVRVIHGEIIDFFMDIRKGSPTFGKIAGCELKSAAIGDSQNSWVWIPFGFAHAFLAKTDCVIEYLCNASWNGECESGVNISDENIDWSLCPENIRACFDSYKARGFLQSDKDAVAMSLLDWTNDPRSEQIPY